LSDSKKGALSVLAVLFVRRSFVTSSFSASQLLLVVLATHSLINEGYHITQ
jgi:hypothetical protein